MRNARQHILDIIDAPDKHQEHAKKFVEKLIFILILHLHRSLLWQVFGKCSDGFSIWQKSKVIRRPRNIGCEPVLVEAGKHPSPWSLESRCISFFTVWIYMLSSECRLSFTLQIHSRLFDRTARWPCRRTDVIQATIARYSIEYGMFLSWLFSCHTLTELIGWEY